jgi:uncharacterized DUF497 family protein
MAGVVEAFDWDEGNIRKCEKHGVSRAEIEFALMHAFFLRSDLIHSRAEDRQQAVGRTHTGRHVFVVFTMRERNGQLLIRPISARYMHLKEVKRYEEDTS